jgi:hypothetical protein
MPIVDLSTAIMPNVGRPVDTPKGFAVTPGLDEINGGSDTPDFGDVASAAFQSQNSIVSSFAHGADDGRDDDGANPWEAIKGTKYEPHFEAFVDARGTRGIERIKRNIDREEEVNKTLAAAPAWQSIPLQIIAGTLDWPTLAPGGVFVRGAKLGYSVSRSALATGLAAGGATAAQEAALQGTQELRTAGESALAIGGSVILGGLLGAAGAKLMTNAEWTAAVKAVDADLEKIRNGATIEGPSLTESIMADVGTGSPTSAGAAAVAPTDIEGNTIAGRAAGAVAAATKWLNPALRVMQSPSPASREVGSQLFEFSGYLNKHLEGRSSGPAVETLMKEWNAGLADAIKNTDASFVEYRKAGGQLDRAEFSNAIGRAMRRSDEDADPHIAKAAKEWRAKVFEPLKKAAIEAKLLPEDVSVETADSYFSRMWNRQRLIAREAEFKGRVQNWVIQEQPKWADQFDRSAERRLSPLRNEIDEIEMAKLRRAEEVRRRSEDGEIQAGEFGEADIRAALRIVEGGAPKPKGVKTLTQFLHDQGGLADIGGELAHLGITNRTRPGFVRARDIYGKGGLGYDEAALRAWEDGYFPHHDKPPSINEFLEALGDDFHKTRAVLKAGDQDAYRLNELVAQLEADLHRVGAQPGTTNRFATSEEVKGIVARVYAAMDAEADRKVAALRAKLTERETELRVERESRFVGDPKELARQIADEVHATLTGRGVDGMRPEFIKITTRGPMKERTFNIPDELVEDFLVSDVRQVGTRYARVMSADVELAHKFGSPDMKDQIQKIRENYAQLRQGVTDEKELKRLAAAEKSDIGDIEAVRDVLRGTRVPGKVEQDFGPILRGFNKVNYIRVMGEVLFASLTEAVRPAMVHGLSQFMQTVPQLLTNLKGIKLSVNEAQLAGNVAERVLGHRMATIAEIIDPYSSRGPVDAFLDNMTNVASKWNGIRLWTDAMKSFASVMTQNRILGNVVDFAKIKGKEKHYLAFLDIDESMAGRIAAQFAEHGETLDGVRVANTAKWTDPVAVRTYRAAINKDVDSIIVMRGVADVPVLANTPVGAALLQFKSFALASNQRVLIRGLQEDQARFIGGTIAMATMGMLITYLKALSGNRDERLANISDDPGWWISNGIDRSGVFAVPMEAANVLEKLTGFNPVTTPIRQFDESSRLTQRQQNRNEIGSLLGPTVGMLGDVATVGAIPKTMIDGKDVTQGQRNAAERLLPYNSYPGMRQMLRYIVNTD